MQEGDLVDVYATNAAVWGVWKLTEGEMEETSVQHMIYDGLELLLHK